VSGLRIPFGAVLAKKGRFYERNQYFLWSADRAVHNPAAPLDAQAETAVGRISITKDVPILRIDHVSTEGNLLGVWQALYSGGVLDFQEMNRRLIQSFARKDMRNENHQVCCKTEPRWSRRRVCSAS
jgi:hypothetical protein